MKALEIARDGARYAVKRGHVTLKDDLTYQEARDHYMRLMSVEPVRKREG